MTEPTQTPVKLTPEQIKERRINAAKEAVEAAEKRFTRADKKVQDATALIEARDKAKREVRKAQKHLAWVESMPLDDEDDEDTDTEAGETVISPDEDEDTDTTQE